MSGNLLELFVSQFARLAQHLFTDTNLADVVHQTAQPGASCIDFIHPSMGGQEVRKVSHPRRVTARVRILGVNGANQGMHGSVKHGALLCFKLSIHS